MSLFGFAIAVIFAAGILAFASMTTSINAIANRQSRLTEAPSVSDDIGAFTRAFAGAVGNSLLEGNKVELFQNGDQIFPPMLEAIDSASVGVNFASLSSARGSCLTGLGKRSCGRRDGGYGLECCLTGTAQRRFPGPWSLGYVPRDATSGGFEKRNGSTGRSTIGGCTRSS